VSQLRLRGQRPHGGHHLGVKARDAAGLRVTDDKRTTAEYLEHWLDNMRSGTVKESTEAQVTVLPCRKLERGHCDGIASQAMTYSSEPDARYLTDDTSAHPRYSVRVSGDPDAVPRSVALSLRFEAPLNRAISVGAT
jgi:hypothetical protein